MTPQQRCLPKGATLRAAEYGSDRTAAVASTDICVVCGTSGVDERVNGAGSTLTWFDGADSRVSLA